MPEYFKKWKVCEPQKARGVSDIYFSIITNPTLLPKNAGQV